ncbi:MAG: HAD-IA family hydrolase [Patescibacteria group bacterium]
MDFVWFDLDGTLYDCAAAYAQFVECFTARLRLSLPFFSPQRIKEERLRLRRKYGGGSSPHLFAREHDLDLEFLLASYDEIDLPACGVRENPKLRAFLEKLAAPKGVFSNSPRRYAERVLLVLGVRDIFGRVICVEDMLLSAKPSEEAFRIAASGFSPDTCFALVDDDAQNIIAADTSGWETMWVGTPELRPANLPLRTKILPPPYL